MGVCIPSIHKPEILEIYPDDDATSRALFTGPRTRHSDECSPLVSKQLKIVTNGDKWWVIVGDGVGRFKK